MNNKKMDWRIVQGLMIVFYILGLIAFSIVGDLTQIINQIIIVLFVILIIREVTRFLKRLKKEREKIS